jgi:hypothetical protein
VAPESRAVIDVRVETQAIAERVEATIHGIEAVTPGVSLMIEGHIGRPPMEHTDQNQRLWRIAQELGEDLDLALEQGTAGGGSDGNTTSLFTATIDGMGAVRACLPPRSMAWEPSAMAPTPTMNIFTWIYCRCVVHYLRCFYWHRRLITELLLGADQ